MEIRISAENIPEDYKTSRTVYFLDIVDGNKVHDITNGSLDHVRTEARRLLAQHHEATIKEDFDV